MQNFCLLLELYNIEAIVYAPRIAHNKVDKQRRNVEKQ